MDPRHDPDLILGHLEGDLSPEDEAKVQALREADPDFGALLDGMASDRNQLRAAPAAEPPAGLTDMAMADLERSMLLDDADDGIAMLPPGRRRFTLAPLLIYGGVAAVLTLTASAVLKSVQPPEPAQTVAAAPVAEPFDIASETIRTQRDLARRDRADVDFDSAKTPAADAVPDAMPRALAAAQQATKRLDTDARALKNSAVARKDNFATSAAPDQAQKPEIAELAETAEIAQVMAGADTQEQTPRLLDNAESDLDEANPASLAPVDAAQAAVTQVGAAQVDAAAAQSPAEPSHIAAAAPPAARPLRAEGTDLSEATPALLPAADRVAFEGTAPPPATLPVWLRPIESLNQDWTQWITLPQEGHSTDAPPAP